MKSHIKNLEGTGYERGLAKNRKWSIKVGPGSYPHISGCPNIK